MKEVKPAKRPYRSPRRAAQAAQTREAILAAAERQLVDAGWKNTTIASIASAAGVAPETIYAGFGSKKMLLQELVVRAVRGAAPAIPLVHQPERQALAEEKNQSRQIDLFASDIASVLDRVAPLMDVVRSAAEGDDEIVALYAELHRGRRKNLEWFAETLLQSGPLRNGMDTTAVTDVLWRLASPELFLLVRRVEKLSSGYYVNWLATTLKALLLRDRDARD